MSGRLPIAIGLLIASAAVVSGPLVPGVDLTRSDGLEPGAGDADLTVETVPTDELRLEEADFGAGRYHIVGPPATVAVGAVTGNPVLRYSIDIPKLSFTITTRYELSGADGQTVKLGHKPTGVSPARIDRDRYEATVSIWVRTGDVFDKRVEQTAVLRVIE